MATIKQAWETAVAFKLVWFRVFCYFFLPVVTTFIAMTDTWSGETWEKLHQFLRWRLLLVCLVPGFLAITAFIDQSLARARDNLAEKRKGDTAPPFLPESR